MADDKKKAKPKFDDFFGDDDSDDGGLIDFDDMPKAAAKPKSKAKVEEVK
jgi:Mor family transcriptional regulator